MKWKVTYSLRSEPNKSFKLRNASNLDCKDYEIEASSKREAIEATKKYILELFKRNGNSVEETGNKLIIYDNNGKKR